jgi:hypothetical protein
MRPPRMTTLRWMIVVVAIIALFYVCLAGVLLWRRHRYFLERARGYDINVSMLKALQQGLIADSKKAGPFLRDRQVRYRELMMPEVAKSLDYDAEMGRKFRRAARFPWLSVEHELPEPW